MFFLKSVAAKLYTDNINQIQEPLKIYDALNPPVEYFFLSFACISVFYEPAVLHNVFFS